VLGGGITGLTAAWHLKRAGFSPVVFERARRVGGVIGAVRTNGWLHELGPNSLLEGSPRVAEFIEAAGLAPRRIFASPAAKRRYIVRRGRLVALPSSPLGFLATRLFSWRAKLGLAAEPWRRRGAVDAEESVADFVVRRLGREFLDYAVNPFVGGVYAGDPARLSVRHAFPKLHAIEQEHGSLIRGAIKLRNPSGGPRGRIFSFPEGLHELPLALARALGDAVRLHHTAVVVSRVDGAWRIELESAGVRTAETFSAVVCALPAGAVAGLRFENVPEAAQLGMLREIEYPPIASVFTGYERSEVAHSLDGFGLLMPQVERVRMLGTLFSSTLFPNRAPEGCVGLTTFLGGMRDPDLPAQSDSDLIGIVHGELSRLLGARGRPMFTDVQRWPRAIPQYTMDYQRFRDAVARVEAAAPGLHIGGNWLDGIALANCLESGRRLAKAVEGSKA
jgi:oxygen-dependent protoporphyrinogen oxidase